MTMLRLRFDHRCNSAALRRAARHRLAGWQTAELVDDTLLVITELVQNVIRHTDDGGELAITGHPDKLLVEVSDSSRDMPQLSRSNPQDIGGRGMLVVSAVSSAWGARRTSGGKTVWAEMPMRPNRARHDR
jgi:anti-sigma regulatory factor (Ser/Thr protein kinase)